jgi:hypothetical protein
MADCCPKMGNRVGIAAPEGNRTSGGFQSPGILLFAAIPVFPTLADRCRHGLGSQGKGAILTKKWKSVLLGNSSGFGSNSAYHACHLSETVCTTDESSLTLAPVRLSPAASGKSVCSLKHGIL